MLAVYAMAVKDLRILLRDVGGLTFLFAMPLVFIVVMSLALSQTFTGGSSDNPIRIPVALAGAGPLAEQVAAELDAFDGFETVYTYQSGAPLTRASANAAVERGDYPLAVVFPEGFSQAISDLGIVTGQTRALQVVVELVVDPATPSQFTDPIEGALNGVIQQQVAQVLNAAGFEAFAAQFGPALPADVRAQVLQALDPRQRKDQSAPVVLQRVYPPNVKPREKLPDTYQQNVPGYTVMGVFFIVTVMAESVIRERDQGTMRRLRAAPIGRWSIVAGKLVPYYVVNLIQVAIMFVVARLAFGMDLVNLPALALVAAGLALAATGLGLLIAAVARTQAQTTGLGVLVVLTTSALGGAFVPSFIMPEAMRTIGKATPQAWAIQGFQDVIVRGQGVGDVGLEAAILAAFGLAFLAFGAWRFRFE